MYLLSPLGPLVHKDPRAWCLWEGTEFTAAPFPLPCVPEAVIALTAQILSFLPLFFFIFLWGLLYDQGFCFLQQQT